MGNSIRNKLKPKEGFYLKELKPEVALEAGIQKGINTKFELEAEIARKQKKHRRA